MTKTDATEATAPVGYSKLPDGVVCKCFKMWRGADGSHWCCLPAKRPDAAIANLTNHQEQCDMDGVMVNVSRQALDEALAYIVRAVNRDSQFEAMVGTLEEAREYIGQENDPKSFGVLNKILAALHGIDLNNLPDVPTAEASK